MTSETALFKPTDAAPHGLAEGRWALHGPGCGVEAHRALPECAVPLVVRNGRLELDAAKLGAAGDGVSALASQGVDYLLVDGDPYILQVKADFSHGGQAGAGEKRAYMSIKVVHRDAAGQIDRAIIWSIPCPSAGETVDGVKAADDHHGACVASKPEAVRAQAPHVPPLFSYFLTWISNEAPPAAK